MSKHLKKISEEIIDTNPWWKYKHDEYELPNGGSGNYYYGESTNCSMVIPVLDDGRLILVSQQRYLRDRVSVEFPCGGLELDESPQAGAEREMIEETGYNSTSFIKVGAFDGLNGLFKDTAHVFIADELSKVSEPKFDSTEEIEIIYRRPDEFEDMIKRGEIWDGQTLAAWAMARDRVMQKQHR